MILSEDLKNWRIERPDEWKMDEFIRKAVELEKKHQPATEAGSAEVPGCTFFLEDFVSGRVRIDFTNYTGEELRHLRKICQAINEFRNTPAYSFGPCYYCADGRWYEGGRHQLKGTLCRATEIVV